MLVIRMQRTGRKGHAMFRIVVQDSRRTPTSGNIVVQLGSYDPHAKTAVLDKDKLADYLKNGAQPSRRTALLLRAEGVKLPKWVVVDTKKAGKTRNPDKYSSDQPKAEAAEEAPAEAADGAEASAETADQPAAEVPAEAEAEASEAPAEATAEPTAEATDSEQTPKSETEKA